MKKFLRRWLGIETLSKNAATAYFALTEYVEDRQRTREIDNIAADCSLHTKQIDNMGRDVQRYERDMTARVKHLELENVTLRALVDNMAKNRAVTVPANPCRVCGAVDPCNCLGRFQYD